MPKPSVAFLFLLALLLVAMTVGGCALPLQPNAKSFAVLPVVKAGSNSATGIEHVIHIPAKTPVPIQFRVEGSFVATPVTSTVEVTFERGVYLYKEWASFDGKT